MVKTLIDSGGTDAQPITLAHPYKLVQMQYTPEGSSEPVMAGDAIDPNSVPNLKAGQVLTINYDAGYPRVASIPGATHTIRPLSLLC
jgi:hypothetical protein